MLSTPNPSLMARLLHVGRDEGTNSTSNTLERPPSPPKKWKRRAKSMLSIASRFKRGDSKLRDRASPGAAFAPNVSSHGSSTSSLQHSDLALAAQKPSGLSVGQSSNDLSGNNTSSTSVFDDYHRTDVRSSNDQSAFEPQNSPCFDRGEDLYSDIGDVDGADHGRQRMGKEQSGTASEQPVVRPWLQEPESDHQCRFSTLLSSSNGDCQSTIHSSTPIRDPRGHDVLFSLPIEPQNYPYVHNPPYHADFGVNYCPMSVGRNGHSGQLDPLHRRSHDLTVPSGSGHGMYRQSDNNTSATPSTYTGGEVWDDVVPGEHPCPQTPTTTDLTQGVHQSEYVDPKFLEFCQRFIDAPIVKDSDPGSFSSWHSHDLQGLDTPVASFSADAPSESLQSLTDDLDGLNSTTSTQQPQDEEPESLRSDAGFVCVECGKIAKDGKKLRSHMTVVHKKAYHCGLCRSSFGRSGLRERHMKDRHRKGQRFYCDKDPKCKFAQGQIKDGFPRRTNLTRHKKCKKCPRGTERKRS